MRVKVAEALTATAPLKGEIQQAYAQRQPFRTGSIQVASPSVKSMEVNSIGAIVITLAAGTISGWKCSAEGVKPVYLPVDCRQ